VDSKIAAPSAKKVFPLTEIRDCLIAELTSLVISEAAVTGVPIPSSPAATLKLAIPLDSLSVVDVLCAVDPIIGFPLHESIVKTGGYKSIEAALEHVMPRIEKAWAKKNGVAV